MANQSYLSWRRLPSAKPSNAIRLVTAKPKTPIPDSLVSPVVGSCRSVVPLVAAVLEAPLFVVVPLLPLLVVVPVVPLVAVVPVVPRVPLVTLPEPV